MSEFDAFAENYKSAYIEKQLKLRIDEISDPTNISVFCGTWNVNNKLLGEGPQLDQYIFPPNQPHSHIYSLGFQEIVDLNPRNVLLDASESTERTEYWKGQTQACLSRSGEGFTLVCEQHIVGLLLLVFVKDSLIPYVRDVRGATVATGVMGVMGNKGGAAARMVIHDTSVCFLASHLAAGRSNVANRNSDTRQILERMVFLCEQSLQQSAEPVSPVKPAPAGGSDIVEVMQAMSVGGTRNSTKMFSRGSFSSSVVRPTSSVGRTNSVRITMSPTKKSEVMYTYRGITDVSGVDINVLEHNDFVFWLGDLNYRIDEKVSSEEVFARVDANDINFLRSNDQLNNERRSNNVMLGFHEGMINFMPTYKFIPGTDNYERRVDKKNRPPAWCDRILWKTQQGPSSVQLKAYSCAAQMNQSDHKPVYGRFECQFRIVSDQKERVVYQDILRIIDKWENDCIPKVEVTGNDIQFGTISYKTPKTSTIVLKNTGAKLLKWQFVSPIPGTSRICKPFYKIQPTLGLLGPGEVMNITVTVLIDNNPLVGSLKNKFETLDDIAVLHVINGSDFYCAMSGVFDFDSVARYAESVSRESTVRNSIVLAPNDFADEDDD